MNLRIKYKPIDENSKPETTKPTSKIEQIYPAPTKPAKINLNGKVVCVTGTITGMTREQTEVKLRKMGAYPVSTVTKSTHYLITGYDVGQRKIKLAKQYNIKIIQAEDAFKI